MTSMDYYSVDKHCPNILSPPVISSTSCMPESGPNDSSLYLNGTAYRASTEGCQLSNRSHSYGHNAKMTDVSAASVELFADSDFPLSSYYNLDSHPAAPPSNQHPQHQQSPYDDMKKSHMSFHPMQSAPIYTNINCSLSDTSQSPGIYSSKEYDSSLYPIAQCPSQSNTSPILSLPDSPSMVSSNSGYHHHSASGQHQTSSSPTSQQRVLCVAKKSTTSCYELKREMAESSGLSLSGTPYVKSRSGRKGASHIASSTDGVSGDSSQFTDADSNSGNPSSKAFVPCKVCGDKASGYHYGVTSCEGCKGFFRRSIQKQIEYRCLRDGKCLIIRLNRNRCQYCRFKKCLAVGMSRDSVRYGRVPKKSKEKERLDEKSNQVTQAEADQSSSADVDSKDLALYDTILTISQAHHANCSYTDDKIKGLNKKPIFTLTSQIKTSDECSSSPDIGSVSESLETKKIELWEHLSLLITPCIQRVVEFAKRIPGFSDLTQDDQLILIKLGFFEVWLVHISKTVDFTENTLMFADGSFLSRKQLEMMFDHEFVGNIFHLMSGFNNLNLNDTEIGLFSAIILLQSDRPQIYDVKTINKYQENIAEALKVQINRNHSNDTQTFQKLMMKINELRAIEIFDIPKSSSSSFANVSSQPNQPVSHVPNQVQQASSTQTQVMPVMSLVANQTTTENGATK